MPDKTQKQIIQETHDDMVEVKTVLLGVPDSDDRGLVGQVKDVKLYVNGVAKSHGRLKRNFWILVGALAGSGVLGTSIWSLLSG